MRRISISFLAREKKYFISFISEATTALFAKESSVLIENIQNFYSLFQADVLHSFKTSRHESLQSMQLWEWEGMLYVHDHSKIKWIRLVATPKEVSKEVITWNGVIQDITDKKHFEIGLQEAAKGLHQLVSEKELAIEAERQRIVSEVHDELGQYMTALRIEIELLGMISNMDATDIRNRRDNMLKCVDSAIQGMRNITINLHATIHIKGVTYAVKCLAEQFTLHTGIPCQVEVNFESADLEAAKIIGVYRIVQESLTNVARHAKASRVIIKLLKENRGTCGN